MAIKSLNRIILCAPIIIYSIILLLNANNEKCSKCYLLSLSPIRLLEMCSQNIYIYSKRIFALASANNRIFQYLNLILLEIKTYTDVYLFCEYANIGFCEYLSINLQWLYMYFIRLINIRLAHSETSVFNEHSGDECTEPMKQL